MEACCSPAGDASRRLEGSRRHRDGVSRAPERRVETTPHSSGSHVAQPFILVYRKYITSDLLSGDAEVDPEGYAMRKARRGGTLGSCPRSLTRVSPCFCVFNRSSTAHPPVNGIVPLLVLKPATGTGRIPSGSQAASTCVAVGIGSETAYAHDLSLASSPSSLFLGVRSSVQTQSLVTA